MVRSARHYLEKHRDCEWISPMERALVLTRESTTDLAAGAPD
jgi:hypothetical protein